VSCGHIGIHPTIPQMKSPHICFGIDCQSPTEAELTPPTKWSPISVTDNREELFLSLASAGQLAVERPRENIRLTMIRKDSLTDFDLESGYFLSSHMGKRELYRPWHGPYRIMKLT